MWLGRAMRLMCIGTAGQRACTTARRLASGATLPSKRIRKVSSSPLIFLIDDFVDADMLARLQRGRRATEEDGKRAFLQMVEDLDAANAPTSPDHHAFMTLVSHEFFNGQWGKKDNVRLAASSSSDSNNDGSARATYPEGLHVDTNNDARFRSVTCILYLNDVVPQCGGATVFPLADVAEAHLGLCASRALLAEKVMHTRQSSGALPEDGVAVPPTLSDSALLETCTDESVLRIQPRAGSLMIFFTRTDDGEIDPRSWHGGERLRDATHPDAVTEKHILTLFKEVHYKDDLLPWPYGCAGQSFESYIAPQIAQQRRRLQDLADAQ